MHCPYWLPYLLACLEEDFTHLIDMLISTAFFSDQSTEDSA